MNILIYLNYKIYNRFIRQGDSEYLAIYSTIIAVTLLFSSNTFAITLAIKLLNPDAIDFAIFDRNLVFTFCGFLIIFNYLLVYAGCHKSNFNKMSKIDNDERRLYLKIYIVGSYLLVGILAIYSDYVKNGHL